MKNVLVVLPVQDRHREKLEAAGKDCCFTYSSAAAVTQEQVDKAQIILGNVSPSMLHEQPGLELLQLNSAGADAYIKPGCLHKNTILTNSTGAYSQAVAEHTLAVLLMLQKKLHLYRDAQRQSRWSDEGTVTSISNCVVLIVGLGDIGRYIATLVKALGAYVIGVNRRGGEKPDCVHELYTTDKVDELLPRADVVISIMPGTKDTEHFYTIERMRLMKRSAIFINNGRGNAISLEVLEQTMREKLVAAAAVDVLETEPLPADSPLWLMDELMITPHASGAYHLPETFERVVDIAASNLSAFLDGRELKNIVDFETGYKA